MPKPKRIRLTASRQKMAAKNTGLVAEVIRCYFPSVRAGTEEWEEAFAEGMVGLCRAAGTFRPETGWKLSTYACTCIRRHLVSWVVKKKQNGFRGLNKRAATPEQLADDGWGLVADRRPLDERKDPVSLGNLEPLVAQLGHRHQTVIRHLFDLGETNREVGERLGVTGKRVQQIRAEAVGLLRGMLDE